MNQIFTIAKVGGEFSNSIQSLFNRWLKQKRKIPVNDYISNPWDSQIRKEIGTFIKRFQSVSTKPPMLFYCEYVDMWSAGWSALECTSKAIDRRLMQVFAGHYEMACYPMPDGEMLRNHLKKMLRQRTFSPPELKMFLLTLREAVEAWELVVPKSSIILIREVVGPIVHDEEMIKSLKRQWKW
jgi:hypothetical protein